LFVGLAIALLIPPYLRLPELGVSPRRRVMRRATVPKAPVHEDRHLDSPEDDVCFAPQTGQRTLMNPVSQPRPVQTRPQRDLDRRVTSALALHARGGGLVGLQVEAQRFVSGHPSTLAPEIDHAMKRVALVAPGAIR
jgi:hypothetical protein